MATPQVPVVVTIRTHPADIERAASKRTPPLPFDAAWKPPSLAGIEKLTVRGDKLVAIVGPRIVQAAVSQTLDEPLTITLGVWDRERELLTSGLLDTKLRIALGSQAFVMTRVAKDGDLLTMEFEDANVAALRKLTKRMKVTRGTVSRIGFVKKLLEEKGAPKLRWYIDAGKPGEVTTEKNPLALSTDFRATEHRKPGPFKKTTIKNVLATDDQIDNLKVVLGHLFDLGATRDELVITVMVGTAESRWLNSATHYDGTSEGIFQQTNVHAPGARWFGGGTERKAAATLFFNALKKAEANAPGLKKYEYAQAVQGSGAGAATGGEANYGPWQDEASKTVSAWDRAFGGSQSPIANKLYEFRRGGLDGTLEDSWECLGRLADEVQYRRFIIEGIFYFLPDELLIGTGPRLVLSETSTGMLTPINFDMDEGVDPQTATFTMHSENWYAPVGTCIELEDMGPGNGVWLVNRTTGDLLDPKHQDIELVRPRAALTEPPADQTLDPSTNSGGGRSFATGRGSDVDAEANDALLPLTAAQQFIVDEARTWLGTPYVYGGNTKLGVDCSGFTKAVYGALGISIDRISWQQFADFPTTKDKARLLAGDMVFFNWPAEKAPGHVGIYIGGGDFIHAPHTGDFVKTSNLESYLASGAEWYGFSRPWNPGGIQ